MFHTSVPLEIWRGSKLILYSRFVSAITYTFTRLIFKKSRFPLYKFMNQMNRPITIMGFHQFPVQILAHRSAPSESSHFEEIFLRNFIQIWKTVLLGIFNKLSDAQDWHFRHFLFFSAAVKVPAFQMRSLLFFRINGSAGHLYFVLWFSLSFHMLANLPSQLNYPKVSMPCTISNQNSLGKFLVGFCNYWILCHILLGVNFHIISDVLWRSSTGEAD